MHKPVHYKPQRGGHSPGYLRDAFEQWLSDWNGREVSPSEMCEYDGEQVKLTWLLGMLWNCTDTMPSHLCSFMDIPQSSSYAVGVRTVKKSISIK